MRNKFSNLLIGIGSVLVLAALMLFLYNQREASAAKQTAMELLDDLVVQIESNRPEAAGQQISAATEHLPDPYSTVMDTVSVDGYQYIGYLTIPSLDMEMPIMSDWSREKLRIASCRYAGSVGGNDLVLMGHNYDSGFGQLFQINVGDAVYFRDVNGTVTAYQVVAKDVLAASAVEEMISGEYDLTLFTCTYGGQNRMTIRCEKTA